MCGVFIQVQAYNSLDDRGAFSQLQLGNVLNSPLGMITTLVKSRFP